KPTPHESCSYCGSYSPCLAGWPLRVMSGTPPGGTGGAVQVRAMRVQLGVAVAKQDDELLGGGAELPLPPMDNAKRADKPATGQGHCDQGAGLHLAADGRLRQQRDAGADLDRLLDVLDVVELQGDLDVRLLLAQEPVHLAPNGQALVEADVLLLGQ